MTKSGGERGPAGGQGEDRRCLWCRIRLPDASGPGRPRRYCSQRCRQWDWVARQRATELALSEHELIITRATLDRLSDDLYVLACAVEDTRSDLVEPPEDPAELRRMLTWLLEAAEPLIQRRIEPA